MRVRPLAQQFDKVTCDTTEVSPYFRTAVSCYWCLIAVAIVCLSQFASAVAANPATADIRRFALSEPQSQLQQLHRSVIRMICDPWPAVAVPASPIGIAATLFLANSSLHFGNTTAVIANNIHGTLVGDTESGAALAFVPEGGSNRLSDQEALSSAIGILFGVLVFVMQPGFALLESGSARAQSVLIVAAKNTFDACIVGIVWFLLGYGLAFGDGDIGGVFGTDQFALSNVRANDSLERPGVFHRLNFFIQFQFAANAITVISGKSGMGLKRRAAASSPMLVSWISVAAPLDAD